MILPPLETLFANYKYGDDEVLPADDVRQVLSTLYQRAGRFQMGEIDDATEVLEAILTIIHCEYCGIQLEDNGDDQVTCVSVWDVCVCVWDTTGG